jgi:hypothetical protein
VNLGAVAPLAVRRYSEEQTRTQQGRLERGNPGFRLPSVTGPDFRGFFESLLPPEQTMPAMARTMTSRAAAALARLAPEALATAEALPESASALPVVADGTPTRATRTAGLPTAEWTVPPSAGQLLGLLQRALGIPFDSGLATGIRLAGGEPLNARPIRPAASLLLRQAETAYTRTDVLAPFALAPLAIS